MGRFFNEVEDWLSVFAVTAMPVLLPLLLASKPLPTASAKRVRAP